MSCTDFLGSLMLYREFAHLKTLRIAHSNCQIIRTLEKLFSSPKAVIWLWKLNVWNQKVQKPGKQQNPRKLISV